MVPISKSYDKISAKITVDRKDWHVISREETVTHIDEPFSPGLTHYSKVIAGILLPIYYEIGQDNLIKAHQEDPKNGIRKLVHEYMLKRKEREQNHE